ncbi:hydrolase [Brevibacillus humidisoli]|uniref:hydrolase n=1 Tax=Brevibacillus humidisoli TaxID=2895522 RepID=UPI001E4362B3|nr:hydrolase [Brevibacillus humidisoli]UFJ39574.1 hydrolase [Brevibacillus humidisoli]
MLSRENTLLVVVDVQGKLARIVHDSEEMVDTLEKLVQGAQILGIPVVWLEQYPEGFGPTIEEIARHLQDIQPIAKHAFNACDHQPFIEAVRQTGRRQILIAGIEAHICVYQTAVGLQESGYEVQVVADAVSSRTEANKQIGIEKMRTSGVAITCLETALYELLRVARGEAFKQILKLVK